MAYPVELWGCSPHKPVGPPYVDGNSSGSSSTYAGRFSMHSKPDQSYENNMLLLHVQL